MSPRNSLSRPTTRHSAGAATTPAWTASPTTSSGTLPGFKHLEGKDAFDGEIENDAFEGSPSLDLDRLIEERNTVVALGSGGGRRKDGEAFRFAFSDVFTFRGDLICRVESHLVPITEPTPASAS